MRNPVGPIQCHFRWRPIPIDGTRPKRNSRREELNGKVGGGPQGGGGGGGGLVGNRLPNSNPFQTCLSHSFLIGDAQLFGLWRNSAIFPFQSQFLSNSDRI